MAGKAVPVALIQGASRGLGLQFCRHILKTRPDSRVIATCRSPDMSDGLQELRKQTPDRLSLQQVDVTSEDDIQLVSQFVKEKYGKLDLLVNTAGILHPSGKGETSLAGVSMKGVTETVATNAIGPLLMASHFKPMLMKGQGAFGQDNPSVKHAGVLVNISAKVGSITDNGLGGWYSYRMAKAALNMATKNLSIELGRGSKKVVCVAMHPGTVDTELSRPYHKNVPADKLFSTEYSVNCLMGNINDLNMNKTGQFLSWDGTVLPF